LHARAQPASNIAAMKAAGATWKAMSDGDKAVRARGARDLT
jgi:hypothetical protein